MPRVVKSKTAAPAPAPAPAPVRGRAAPTRGSARRASPAAPAAATHEQTAFRAYELFLRRGAAHGHDVEDWLMAEQELRAPAAATPRRARETSAPRAADQAAGRQPAR